MTKKCGQVTKRPTCTPLNSQTGIWWKRTRGTWSTGGWWCCASEQSPLRHSCTRLRTALPSENKLFVLWVFPNMLWKLCNTACFFLLGWFNFWDGSRTIEWRSGILFPSFLTCYPPQLPLVLPGQTGGRWSHIYSPDQGSRLYPSSLINISSAADITIHRILLSLCPGFSSDIFYQTGVTCLSHHIFPSSKRIFGIWITNLKSIFHRIITVVHNCGFCSNRILHYFPLFVRPSVRSSQVWHLTFPTYIKA